VTLAIRQCKQRKGHLQKHVRKSASCGRRAGCCVLVRVPGSFFGGSCTELVDAAGDGPKLTAEGITSLKQFKSRSKRSSFCIKELLRLIPRSDFA